MRFSYPDFQSSLNFQRYELAPLIIRAALDSITVLIRLEFVKKKTISVIVREITEHSLHCFLISQYVS